MTGRNIGVVLTRLLAIYLAVSALQNFLYLLPSFFSPMMEFPDTIMSFGFWLSIAAILFPVACAIWIWRNESFIVTDQTDTEALSITAAEFMVVGVSLLGIYFFVSGTVSLGRLELGLARNENVQSAARLAQRAPIFIQIVIAILMLLGRRGLATLLLKIKYAGTGRG